MRDPHHNHFGRPSFVRFYFFVSTCIVCSLCLCYVIYLDRCPNQVELYSGIQPLQTVYHGGEIQDAYHARGITTTPLIGGGAAAGARGLRILTGILRSLAVSAMGPRHQFHLLHVHEREYEEQLSSRTCDPVRSTVSKSWLEAEYDDDNWDRQVMSQYTHTHTHTDTDTQTHTQTHIHARTHTHNT